MNTQQNFDDEIDLTDYLKIIIKRKKIVSLTVFLCVIMALIAIYTRSKIYESTVILRIGSVSQIVIPKQEVFQYLQSEKTMNNVIKNLNNGIDMYDLKEMLKGKDIKIEDIENTDLVKISVKNLNPVISKKICDAISGSFIAETREVYNKNYSLLNSEIHSLENRIRHIDKQINEMNEKILAPTQVPYYPFIMGTATNYEQVQTTLNEKLYLLRERLLNAKESEVFENPIIPKFPVNAFNKKLIIIIFGVSGVILGAFVALFQEFWKNNFALSQHKK